MKPNTNTIDWSKTDLTRPSHELATELRVPVQLIYAARIRYGVTAKRAPHRRSDKPAIDWSNVDLTRPAYELADELQVAVPSIYSKRKLLKVTATRAHHRKLKERKLMGVDWRTVDLTRPARELAAEFNVTRQAISLARIKNGVINGVKGWRYVRAADSYENNSNAF